MSSLVAQVSSWTRASPSAPASALNWLNSPYVYAPLLVVLGLLCLVRFSKTGEQRGPMNGVHPTLTACLLLRAARTPLVFAWNCFIQPIGKVANQSERLDRFYQHQASSELRDGAQ